MFYTIKSMGYGTGLNARTVYYAQYRRSIFSEWQTYTEHGKLKQFPTWASAYNFLTRKCGNPVKMSLSFIDTDGY